MQIVMPNQGQHALWPAGTDVTVHVPSDALRALPVDNTRSGADAAPAAAR